MTSPGNGYEDMRANQGQQPPKSGQGRAALIGAAVAAAVVAAFAVGFLVNRSDDSDTKTPVSSTPSTASSSTTAIPIPPPISQKSIVAPQPTNPKPTAPQPTPLIQPTVPPHTIGDDCSHGNIVAQWGKTPDGQWVCIPQEQGSDEHQVGDDCSHDGIIAQWSWTGAKWICVPQEQGGDDTYDQPGN